MEVSDITIVATSIGKNLKIEIRPIPNRKGIRSFSENLEHFSQSHLISPLVNPETLKYRSGLSLEDKQYLKDIGFPYDFEDETYRNGVAHPFWENPVIKVELKNTPDFLYPGRNPIDFVKYKYLLDSKYIYESEAKMREGDQFEATHYLYDEVEEVAIKATEIDKRKSVLKKLDKLSKQKRKDIILVLANENTDNKDEDYLTVRMNDICQDKRMFEQLTDILNNSLDDISIQAEIKSAVQKNVLKRNKSGIFFYDTNLGFNEEAVKDFLSKEENQETYLMIKSKI